MSHSAVFVSDTPATTLASKTPQAAPPAAAAPQGEAGWAPQVPVAARRVSIDVGEGDSSVRITIHERAGDISVKIDSATDTLHGQLQSSAGTLVEALRREQVPLSNLDFSSTPDNSANPDQRRQRNPNSPKSQKAAAQADTAILADSVNLQS